MDVVTFNIKKYMKLNWFEKSVFFSKSFKAVINKHMIVGVIPNNNIPFHQCSKQGSKTANKKCFFYKINKSVSILSLVVNQAFEI